MSAPPSGARRMAPLTLETLGDLPATCRACVAWELDPAAAAQAVRSGDPGFDKEAWLSTVLLSWGGGGATGGPGVGAGGAGRVAYVGDQPVGYVSVAPPAFVPRVALFPTAPVSADAVLLVAGRIDPAHRGAGIARMLVQGVAKDLTQRGVRALEAFARATEPGGGEGDGAPAASGEPDAVGAVGVRGEHGTAGPAGCLLPQDFFEAVGFSVVREHHRFPRMRLELRSALDWREDVEAALEQLLASLTLAGTR